jgi:pimeloyl-ACP methyl ester carboxylesterase
VILPKGEIVTMVTSLPLHSIIFAAMLPKMKERILIAFHTQRLNMLSLFSPNKAAISAYRLFITPPPLINPIEAPSLPEAEPLQLKIDGMMAQGYRWSPPNGGKNKVLLVHGYRSQALKFEHMVPSLLEKGFTVLAFDGPAHGKTTGKHIQPFNYMNMILAIEEVEGPIYAFVGHSLGGLALALTMEKIAVRSERKLILIAPATETHRSFSNFFSIIPLNDKVQQRFREYVERLSGLPISYLSIVRILQNITMPVLWIHDKGDSVCPLEDAQPLIDKQLPNIEFYLTENLGHNKIYRNPEVVRRITEFINNPSSDIF